MKLSVVEWVDVTTKVVTAVTAVVMAYLAYRTYLKAPQQSDEPEPQSATANDAGDKLTEALVFKTSKQQTWLTVTEEGLSCRIDDVREGRGGPQWRLSKAEARAILSSEAYRVNAGYKVRTGTFSIGSRRSWLYTKALYPEPEYLRSVLKQLLQAATE